MTYTERLSEQIGAIGGVEAATLVTAGASHTSPVFDAQAEPYFQRIGAVVQLSATATAAATGTNVASATATAGVTIQIQAAAATGFSALTLTTLASETFAYSATATAQGTAGTTTTTTVVARCGADIEASELGANRYVRAILTYSGSGGPVRGIVLAGSPRYEPAGDSN